MKDPRRRVVILRHDVDRNPERSVRLARIERERGLRGTFYFRATRGGFDGNSIEAVSRLGHEVGYHYEDLARSRGNRTAAIESFERNLRKLRALVPVETVCMHGSPLSTRDNRSLWVNGVHYGDFGIKGEPYFDLDFSSVGYLSDTGRRWDGAASLRDRVNANSKLRARSTHDVIWGFQSSRMPRQLMLTLHPQRWTDDIVSWSAELIGQVAKNQVKRAIILFSRRSRS